MTFLVVAIGITAVYALITNLLADIEDGRRPRR